VVEGLLFAPTAHANPSLRISGDGALVFDGSGNLVVLGSYKAVYTQSAEGVLNITFKASGVSNPSQRAIHFDATSTGVAYVISFLGLTWETIDWQETLSANGQIEVHIKATEADLL
jgi:hypothetical protein